MRPLSAPDLMPAWDFDTPGPVHLDLELPIGRVDVETMDGTTTHVDLEGTSDVQDLIQTAVVESRPRGGGHEVRVEVRRRSGFFLSFGHTPDLRLRVTAPPDAEIVIRTKSADVRARGRYGSAEVKTASGDINLDAVTGDVRVKTASGDLALWEAGGTAHVQTASGDVAFQQTRGDVTVQAVSGDVWIKDASSSAHVTTVSGDQRLDAVVEGAIEAHAVSGDIMIGVRRGSRVYVDANTISGSTHSELSLTDAPAEDGGEGTDGDGPMVEVRAKTVSGDISIVRAAAPAPTSSG
jgi:Putative adhesin